MQSRSSSGAALSLLTPLGASYYARSKLLSPEHYQTLMDRGWRRSGSLLYLPDASRSCCPHYTIRLAASEFKPTRDQRQSLYRWNRYVLGEKYIKDASVKFPRTKEEKKRLNAEFDLLATIHESEVDKLHPGLNPQHRFEVTLEPDQFTEEKFELFAHYQRSVHHEKDGDISRPGFKRFLCSSPITRKTEQDGTNLGSYHQCYRLDGRLIAMAVLDLLPHAVSGVYFIYHNDFENWSFGKLSACREAALALEAGHEYYYMGYYIHSCKKMRYKGDFKPQYVLDNVSLDWNRLDDEMRSLMDTRKYASMSEERARKARKQSEGGAEASDGPTEEETLHPLPQEAMASGLSILDLGMPGVLSLDRLEEEIDLDEMKIYLGKGKVHLVTDLTSWDLGSVEDRSSLKGMFAEFAAVLGPSLTTEVVVDFEG